MPRGHLDGAGSGPDTVPQRIWVTDRRRSNLVGGARETQTVAPAARRWRGRPTVTVTEPTDRHLDVLEHLRDTDVRGVCR